MLFYKPNDDVSHNTFISEQIKGKQFDDGIYFKIEKVRGKIDKENFDAKRTLENGTSQANFSMIQSQSRMEQEQKDMETLLSIFAESTGDQQDQSFSPDDNVIPKKEDEVEKRLQLYKS